MITIQILGLDEFVTGRYSRENTSNLAQLFETGEDDISFYAPNSMIFHNGVEQTSWNVVVIVLAPRKYRSSEREVADYIGKTLNLYAINIQVLFQYYDEASFHTYDNDQYPRFITSDEIRDDGASMEFGDMPEEMEGDIEIGERIDLSKKAIGDGDDDIYLGDAFEGFDEKLEEIKKKKGN